MDRNEAPTQPVLSTKTAQLTFIPQGFPRGGTENSGGQAPEFDPITLKSSGPITLIVEVTIQGMTSMVLVGKIVTLMILCMRLQMDM